MNTQEFEKEPFQDPKISIFREEFHRKSIEEASHDSPKPSVRVTKPHYEELIYEDQDESLEPEERLKRKVARLENALRQKTDRCLATGERLDMIINYRKYEAGKVDHFQDLSRKLKDRVRIDSKKEVDLLLRDRRTL
jgi:hypothetical protein